MANPSATNSTTKKLAAMTTVMMWLEGSSFPASNPSTAALNPMTKPQRALLGRTVESEECCGISSNFVCNTMNVSFGCSFKAVSLALQKMVRVQEGPQGSKQGAVQSTSSKHLPRMRAGAPRRSLPCRLGRSTDALRFRCELS